MQGQAFRAENRAGANAVALGPGQGNIRLWFSPNTVQTAKPSKNPATPVDVQEVFDLLWGAKKGVLFLAFQPGRPSIVTELKQVYSARIQAGKRLFVRGAATDQSPAQEFKVDLFHRTARRDASVVSVAGIDDDFSYWQRELYVLGHAVIHDKIVVVDPFTPDCAVVTGSHNLGFKASYSNDENLLIIRGNRAVAEAYAAHVLDIYDHFRWRYRLQQAKLGGHLETAWQDLDEGDGWQDKYFDGRMLASSDVAFWE
jgi:phosphatidylserine/phosphatidylglycerophosphate/cardiolipin synthase-like enzyme